MADKAVLAGINNYRWISDLRGCLNDLDDMADVLTEHFGFSPDNIERVADGDVTKENVTESWKWLLKDAREGDRLVFHFSGHGSHTVDEDGDEADGADELLCLADMDWDDSESYLLDDDLRRLTERVPAGARLTVVLDCCHSGSGTRMLLAPSAARSAEITAAKMPIVDVAVSLARLKRESKLGNIGLASSRGQTALDEILSPTGRGASPQSVIARFVQPPPEIQARVDQRGVRNRLRGAGFRERSAGAMNHVLLAGSQSDQTSADAFIDGDYHGAFTYYLCETIREQGDELTHQDAIKKLRKRLKKEQFQQNPQLEPEGATGPLFSGLAFDASGGPDDTNAGSPGDAAAPQVDTERMNQLLQELADVLQGFRAASPPATRRTGKRALLYVHGICRHEQGYSESWWRALRRHLASDLARQLDSHRHEVLWSDLVTSTREAMIGIDPDEQREEQLLAAQLEAVLRDRSERVALESAPQQRSDAAPRGSVPGDERAMLGIPGLNCVDDFVKYLVSARIRSAVIERFHGQLVPLLRDGFDVDIISHSWGSVVAYEALWELAGESFLGRPRSLFTVGSALSIGPVKRRIRPASGGRPPHLARWVNLDARGDVVGGPLQGRPFAVDNEFLNLVPTGCSGLFGLVSPACAHSSYFHADNQSVNRHIFARFMGD